MATLHVVRFRPWAWNDDLRLPGVAGEPPSALEGEALRAAAAVLADAPAATLLASSDGEAGITAAAALAEALGGRIKLDADSRLREMNFGLWQGLTVGEIRMRHAKAYRQWREQSERTAPPSGEGFADAADRLLAALNGAVRRARGGDLIFVLSPLVAAVLHCRLYGKPFTAVWDALAFEQSVRSYPLERISLVEETI